MNYTWYKHFPKNKKYVDSLFTQGVGYFRLDNWPPDIYAFRRVDDSPPPEYLVECMPSEILSLERLREQRQ